VTILRPFTFGIAPKVTKGLGPKPPKLKSQAVFLKSVNSLRQYGFFYGIPPGFSPAERFFRQRPRGYGGYGGYESYWTQTVQPPVPGFIFDTPCFIKPP